MASTLVRGGDAVLSDAAPRRVDLRLADGKIVEIGPALKQDPCETLVEADGLLVLPGLIDCHTHFGISRGHMESLDDFAVGSASAAAGGVTTYINFAPQDAGESLLDALRRHRYAADGHTLIDYGVHLSFGTPSEHWAEELTRLIAAGVSSVKVYTTYRDSDYYTRDYHWLSLMEHAAALGMLVMVHAENDDIVAGRTADLLRDGKRTFAWHGESRPPIAELEGVARGLVFSHETGCPIYFVHLTNPDCVALVRKAREQGIVAYSESCPHYLSLDHSAYRSPDAARFVMTPPLRSRADTDDMARRATIGQIDTVGSDHCGYTLSQRGDSSDFTRSSPGIPGVETLWPVLHTELCVSRGMPVEAAVRLVTTNPARLFGLPKKGSLQVGMDADLTLFDPRERYTLDEAALHSGSGYSPWHGRELQGRVVRTISRGITVYDGDIVGDLGHGQYIPRAPGTLRAS
ncbi:amidohydrolase family protein [Rhodococcus sp. T7]|uniref:amidohydrolase family protein n=1 Tax=Rhodococcus sp. T7 TaxID=627444 RepID=UPI00135C5E79|nr:amidohydrolase family protein [Rhodococcus sp. T7]KAF0964727.1 D-phenylhydantoinase [Rhodococcus sp. T7]